MNLMDAVQALSLQDKERLFSYLGQLIQHEKFYKANEGVRKMEEVKMSVCAAMNLTTYDPRSRERENVIVRIITANVLLGMGYTEISVGKVMRYFLITIPTEISVSPIPKSRFEVMILTMTFSLYLPLGP